MHLAPRMQPGSYRAKYGHFQPGTDQHHEPQHQQRSDLVGTSGRPQEFDEIDAILDDLRTRYDGAPQWEFCRRLHDALIYCRRLIACLEFAVLLAW